MERPPGGTRDAPAGRGNAGRRRRWPRPVNKRVVSIMITIIPGIALGESDDVRTLSFRSKKKKKNYENTQ